jgi:hypothetical protein
MPLMLQENFTVKLLEMLRTGEIDCAILAEPFPDTGLAMAPLYDEPFMAAVPSNHPLAANKSGGECRRAQEETMLLLGNGHCFRDHVLEVCPEFARFSSNAEGIRKSFEGSSLETIKHMVAAGMGVTLVPRLSVPKEALEPRKRKKNEDAYVKYLPFEGAPPTRRVVLAWRRSFTRYEAIAALRNAVYACELPGVAGLPVCQTPGGHAPGGAGGGLQLRDSHGFCGGAVAGAGHRLGVAGGQPVLGAGLRHRIRHGRPRRRPAHWHENLSHHPRSPGCAGDHVLLCGLPVYLGAGPRRYCAISYLFDSNWRRCRPGRLALDADPPARA